MVLPDFKDNENCNAMSFFTVLRHFPRNTLFAMQCNAFISLLWFLFSEAAGNQHN